ncbi:MAG: InlB B-repeat-containing protein [Candidatus Faecousia sp.]|nr:InlB B-repeat-containing protein [Candidatus Faecousia sp.]
MKTVSKKLLSLLLVVLLLAAAVPFQAFAETYDLKIVIREGDAHGTKKGEVTLTLDNPVTKTQINDAVIGKVGSGYTITHYYEAAGSAELTDFETLDSAYTEILVVVTPNTSSEETDIIKLTLDAGAGKISGMDANKTIIPLAKNSEGKAQVGKLPTAEQNGYKFLGWFVGDKQIENGCILDADTTATAKYELLTKNILVKGVKTTESKENAKLISEYNAAINQSLLAFLNGSDVVAAVQASVPTGYSLKTNNGAVLWYNFNSGDQLTGQEQVTSTAQTILVKYEPKTFTLYFQANGGTVSPTNKSVTYDAKVGTLPTPTKSGDVFMGWFDEAGNQYTADTVYKVDGNTTLTARWQNEALVLLRIYRDNKTSTPDRIVDITGKVVGNSVSQTEVEKIVKNYYSGSNMKLVGLFTDATWAEYKAGTVTKGDPNVTIQETAKTNIHVVVKNASNSTTSTTSPTTATTKPADKDNPKTGDSMMIYTASAVMIVAAAALVVIQVLRKKRTF